MRVYKLAGCYKKAACSVSMENTEAYEKVRKMFIRRLER